MPHLVQSKTQQASPSRIQPARSLPSPAFAASSGRMAQLAADINSSSCVSKLQATAGALNHAAQLKQNPASTAPAAAQRTSDKVSSDETAQLVQCGKCGQNNSHSPTCPNRKAAKQSHAGKGTHKPGKNHDDGTGYTHSGAGAEMHDHGLHAQAVHERQKGFYAEKRKKK